jgi:hypothetical protein
MSRAARACHDWARDYHLVVKKTARTLRIRAQREIRGVLRDEA